MSNMIEIRAAIAYEGFGVNVKDAWGYVPLMKEMIGVVVKSVCTFLRTQQILQFLNLIY